MTKEQMDRWIALGFPFDDFTQSLAKDIIIPEDELEQKNSLILITSVEGPQKITVGKSYLYKVTGYSRNDFKLKDIIRNIKWAYSIDNGSLINISQRAEILAGSFTAALKWKVPDIKGKFIKMYAWLEKPSKEVFAGSTLLNFPFIFDKYKVKGMNATMDDIADDMCYGNGVTETPHTRYFRKEIEELGVLMSITMESSEPTLWIGFTDMVTTWFSMGELEKVALKMIGNFKENRGREFSDATLQKKVTEHPSTKLFCKNIEKGMKDMITKNMGDIAGLINEEPHNNTSIKRGKYGRPQFSTGTDTTDGLRILINDTWAYEVLITKYEEKQNGNYTIFYKVILYDHFGLDIPDVQNSLYYSLVGFRSWFVLQHLKNFKPFVTKVEFEKKFSGSIVGYKK